MAVTYGTRQKGCSEADENDTLVIFTVYDTDDTKLATRKYDIIQIPEVNQVRAMLMGVNKKLTDGDSDEKDKLAKLDLMDARWKLLKSGEWNMERVVGTFVVSPAVEALAQLSSLTIPEVQEGLAGYDKDVKNSILNGKEVQELAKVIAEKRKNQDLTGKLDRFLSQS